MEVLSKYSSTIILYTIIVISATIIAFASYRKGVNYSTEDVGTIQKKPTINLLGAAIVFLVLWFPIAFANCGADYSVYNMLFERAHDWAFCVGYHQIEIGWAALNYIIRIFTDSVDVYNAIIAFIFLLLVFKGFFTVKNVIHFGWGILAFATCVYLPFMNLKRISVAMAIIFCAMKPFLERKYFKTIVYIAIATLFHTSAIIMIVPLAVNLMLGKKLKYWQMIVGGLVALLAIYSLRERVVSIAISDRYVGYGVQNSSFGVLQIVYHLPLLYFLWKQSIRKKLDYTMECLILLICSFIVGSMGYFISTIGRTYVYFLFMLCCIPSISKTYRTTLESNKSYCTVRIGMQDIIYVMYFGFRLWTYFNGLMLSDQIAPYSNIFGMIL